MEALREIWVRVFMNGMSESPVYTDATGWRSKSSSEVIEELSGRWLSYETFWQDFYGQERAMKDAQMRLVEEVHDKVRDGILVTRAQVVSVDIRKIQPQKPSMRNSKQEQCRMFSKEGCAIDEIYMDRCQWIKEALHGDAETFECIALSISAKEAEDSQKPQVTGTKEPSAGDHHREQPDGWVSIRRVHHWRLEPCINALIIRR
ncbi:hypothetical protein HD806DRAFT_360773 [Xylariaceae sp. AK1471]|nr:hypothetical protein HD806DRAFT_360773 [Xylariaceae sp. AK1471]